MVATPSISHLKQNKLAKNLPEYPPPQLEAGEVQESGGMPRFRKVGEWQGWRINQLLPDLLHACGRNPMKLKGGK